MAAASLPPTALVSMTAEETGGGIQPTTCNLVMSEEDQIFNQIKNSMHFFNIPLEKHLIYYCSELQRVYNQCHGDGDEDKGIALNEYM